MTQIKYMLVKFEKALVFQVLEMNDLKRHCPDFTARNGWKVESISWPQLCIKEKTISLRGSNSRHDYDLSAVHFNSNAERDIADQHIRLAIREWAEWVADSGTNTEPEPNVTVEPA